MTWRPSVGNEFNDLASIGNRSEIIERFLLKNEINKLIKQKINSAVFSLEISLEKYLDNNDIAELELVFCKIGLIKAACGE